MDELNTFKLVFLACAVLGSLALWLGVVRPRRRFRAALDAYAENEIARERPLRTSSAEDVFSRGPRRRRSDTTRGLNQKSQ